MKFEELPEAVKALVIGKTQSSIYFRPPKDFTPQRYVPLTQIERIGLLTRWRLVEPPKDWPYAPGLNIFAYGMGFAAWEGRVVLEDISDAKRNDKTEFPQDVMLDFYQHDGSDYYIASQRVFTLLEKLGAIHPDMSRHAYHAPPSGIEQTPWIVVDFPKAPVVDYSRTATEWRIVDLSPAALVRQIYVPNPLTGPGELVLHEGDFGPIVRDKDNRDLILVKRDVLEILRSNGVRGPDYMALGD
jgi:hypothetical protein